MSEAVASFHRSAVRDDTGRSDVAKIFALAIVLNQGLSVSPVQWVGSSSPRRQR